MVKGCVPYKGAQGILPWITRDTSFLKGGNKFRDVFCLFGWFTLLLSGADLQRSFVNFSNWLDPLGWALGLFFFFSPLSHFPAMFWTAFLPTSYSPWGIVSAWWDWMIVLIHKGMESDSNQGTQRKLRSQVQQWAQLKCGELCSLWLLGSPERSVFLWSPWNGTSLTALRCRYCTSRSFLFPFL